MTRPRPLRAAAVLAGAAAAGAVLAGELLLALLAVVAVAAVAAVLLAQERRRAVLERLALARRLEEQSAMLAEAALLARLGSFTADPVTMAFSFTDELYALWGVPPGSPLRQDPDVFARHVLHPDDQPRVVAAFDDGLAHGGRHDVEFRIRRIDTGQERCVRSTVEVVLGVDGRPVRISGAQLDVTELVDARLQAQDASALHRAVLAATPDVVFVTDLVAQAPVYVSPSMQQVLGYRPEDITGAGAGGRALHVHPDDLPVLADATARARLLGDGEVVHARYRCRHVDGRWVWVARRATPFQRDEHGAVTQLLGVLRDVSDVVAAEERLEHAARHDPLTGLANRTLLTERLQAATAQGRTPVVVYLDLDGFKRVNDTAGHAAGDEVLREVARRLQGAVGPSDTVSRLGGDEFVVLLLRDDDEDGSAVLAEAQGLLRVLDAPVDAGGTTHVVRASGGVVACRGHDVEQLLEDADTAMYRAKALGKDRLELFEQGLRDELAERLRVERVLRDALADAGPVPHPRGWPRLELVYQVVVADDVVVGVEALSRLTDHDGRPVRPDLFIPVAEESGLVRALGVRVLDRALGQLAAWRAEASGREHLTMAVNVSAREAQDAGLADRVLERLAAHGLRARDLVLELTETVLLEAGEDTLRSLERLHDLGVRIAIDDFGTGYASLRYLTELPVDLVKVDRGFTAGLPHDVKSATVVRAVVGLAEDLGLGCVVEGVETSAQRDALPAHVHLQGYLLGRPLPAGEVDLDGRRAAVAA